MARKSATFLQCDASNCNVMVEVGDGEVPAGWHQVSIEKDGRYSTQDRWEFHSAKCVAYWARGREKAVGKKRTPRVKKEKVEAESVDDVLAALSLSQDPRSVSELAGILDVHRSHVDRTIQYLVDEGQVMQVDERRGPHPATYRLHT